MNSLENLHPFRGRLRNWLSLFRVLLVVVALFGLLASSSPAAVDLVIGPGNVIADTGGNGSFDFFLMNRSTTDSYLIGGFDLEVLALGGITFTVVDMSTSMEYLFTGHSAADQGWIDFVVPVSLPSSSFQAQDVWADSPPPGGATLGPGETKGLAHVVYTGGTEGQAFDLVFGSLTGLYDENFDPLDFETQGQGAIPEPGSLLVWSLMALTGCGVAKCRRRRV